MIAVSPLFATRYDVNVSRCQDIGSKKVLR
jgi:hypothetical protein